MAIFLSRRELAATEPAERAAFRSPVPTRMVSNGEFNPLPQTDSQRRFEARLKELAAAMAKKLGMSRRSFLQTSCGMATAFVALNDVFGPIFAVAPAEAADPQAAAQRASGLAKQFILDVRGPAYGSRPGEPGAIGIGSTHCLPDAPSTSSRSPSRISWHGSPGRYRLAELDGRRRNTNRGAGAED